MMQGQTNKSQVLKTGKHERGKRWDENGSEPDQLNPQKLKNPTKDIN